MPAILQFDTNHLTYRSYFRAILDCSKCRQRSNQAFLGCLLQQVKSQFGVG
jgi:hypothetical protein